MIAYGEGKQHEAVIARAILTFGYWLSPGHIWILRKPFNCPNSQPISTHG